MRYLKLGGQMKLLGFRVSFLLFILAGCVGPPVLERQVLGYDEVTSEIDQKLLLLNIARVDRGRPVHFTTTSSIAATFDWTTTLGVGGQITSGSDVLDLNLSGSASENPTFSIIPISGEDFTKRILTPFDDAAFEFLVFQGGDIDRVMRLMARGVEEENPDGTFKRFISNAPSRRDEYEEFRQLVLHLRWLNDSRRLFVRTLVFEETLIDDHVATPSPEDFNDAFATGLEWRQKSNGNFKLIRLRAGRTAVTNFDPKTMTDRERFELNERIRRNPRNFVYLDIRPDRPGDIAIRGTIKLRSVQQMLEFVADGIRSNPEFDVAPDPRTLGPVPDNPTKTLQINVTDGRPDTNQAFMEYGGRYYSVNDTEWDRANFALFGDLLNTAVGDVENIGIPITIAK